MTGNVGVSGGEAGIAVFGFPIMTKLMSIPGGYGPDNVSVHFNKWADAVLEVLKGAIGEWGAPRELLSDNGRQFVAWRGKSRFQKVLTRQGVQHVRSAPQHPMTLGKIERFWKTIWDEFLEEAMEHPTYADVHIRWEGQAEQTKESIDGLGWRLGIALIAMFGLLTFEFRSYFQPLLILAVIPFGAVGAIIGHLIMRLDVTIFSLFGMVALSGVVINDSIVLIDFINRRVRDGVPVKDALMDAGRRRFRPVLLTSITTVAGLLPLLTETSLQAQVLIPMATSLCFGLMFSTVLILILVPSFYQVHAAATFAATDGNGTAGAEEEASSETGSGDADGASREGKKVLATGAFLIRGKSGPERQR